MIRIFAVLLALTTGAFAQSGTPLKQSGNVTPSHVWCVVTNGIAGDCGTAAIPYATTFGTWGSGPTLCAWTALVISGAAQQICLGGTTAGGAEIYVQNYGTASALPLLLNLNGTIYQFPFSTSGVVGPSSSTIGDLACWNNTSGTLLDDCTILPNGTTATTQSTGDTSTKVATDAFVSNSMFAVQPNGSIFATPPAGAAASGNVAPQWLNYLAYWTPTLHDASSINTTNPYGGDACGNLFLQFSANPVTCFNTDELFAQSESAAVINSYTVGASSTGWAAGDIAGFNLYLGNSSGSFTNYAVTYTVQAGDISGGGASSTTKANIAARLATCINGTGSYTAGGGVPSTPANCSGTSTFLSALSKFPDETVFSNGYVPGAYSSGAVVSFDFPWGFINQSNTHAGYPTTANYVGTTVTSTHGTLTFIQSTAANMNLGSPQTGISGNRDAGATINTSSAILGRTITCGDLSSGYTTQDLSPGGGLGISIEIVNNCFAANASGAVTSGTSVTVGTVNSPTAQTLGSGGSTFLVADQNTPCAIIPNTTVSVSGSTWTLSNAVNATAPCPGIQSGDMLSVVNSASPVNFAHMAAYNGGGIYIGQGMWTPSATGASYPTAGDPGVGYFRADGGYYLAANLALSWSATAGTIIGGNGSVQDITVNNSSSGTVCDIAHAGSTWACGNISAGTSITGPDSGVWGSGGINGSAIGGTTSEPGAFTTLNAKTSISVSGDLAISSTAPTISSGFGSSPSVTASNGTVAFDVNVGTGGSASSGVIGLPTATTGWNCYATDITTQSTSVFLTKQTASSTASATLTNYNTAGSATAWAASDHLRVSCFAF